MLKRFISSTVNCVMLIPPFLSVWSLPFRWLRQRYALDKFFLLRDSCLCRVQSVGCPVGFLNVLFQFRGRKFFFGKLQTGRLRLCRRFLLCFLCRLFVCPAGRGCANSCAACGSGFFWKSASCSRLLTRSAVSLVSLTSTSPSWVIFCVILSGGG